MRFWGYVARRAVWGGLVFVILCYAFAAVIYGYLEVTLKEQLRGDALEAARSIPGVTAQNIGVKVDELYQRLLKLHAMDGPFIPRVHKMATKLLRFDFGRTRFERVTTVTGYPYQRTSRIVPVVLESSVVTVCLFGGAYLVQLVFAYFLGMSNAVKRRASRATMLLGVSFQGISIMTLSLLAVFVFSFCLPLHPTDPWTLRLPWTYNEPLGPWLADLFHHFWLPFAVLTLGTFWQTAYLIEKLAWGVESEEHVTAARARGLSERHVKYGIVTRCASPALITAAVQGLFLTLWGSFIVERVFSVPGVGALFVTALEQNDRFLAAGVLICVTLVFQVGLFALDVSYGALDPRIRVGAKVGSLA